MVGSTAVPAARAGRRGWLVAASALVAGLGLGVAIALWWSGRAAAPGASPELTRLELGLPDGAGVVRGLALSPDGRRLVFAARGTDGRMVLWLRPLDSPEARELPGTEGARYPFWSPDSRRIGYFGPRGLAWTDAAGGPSYEVAPTSTVENVRGAAWGADDIIVYTPNFTGPMFTVSARGGAATPATRLPESGEIGTTRFPAFHPDGRRFVYYAAGGTGTEPGSLYLGRVGSLEAKLLGPASSAAQFAGPEQLIYARGEAIVAHRFDPEAEELAGTPVPLGIAMGSSLSVSGLRSISVAANGLLVYRHDRRGFTDVVMVDRAGKDLGGLLSTPPTWHYAPRLSPDEGSLAVSHLEPRSGLGEVWVHDLRRRVGSRVTLGESDGYMPVWLPGGREIVYASTRRRDPGALYRLDVQRPGEERLWLSSDIPQSALAISPDGRRLLFERNPPQGGASLWVRDLEGEAHPVALGSRSAHESSASISPDGRWMAYVSDATRSWEVYLRRLDGTGSTVRVSNDGGNQPLWRRDGRELFYVDARGRLVAVPVEAGDPPRLGAPQPLFDARLEESVDRQYDAFADGQRFVINRAQESADTPVVVILDWRALVAGRAP